MIKTPAEIYQELDKYIVGQKDSKERLAALGYLFSVKLEQSLFFPVESLPRFNCMIIGPTGSGKTEMAYRLSKCLGVPFSRIDCTTLTPAGYKGTNLDTALCNTILEFRDADSPGVIILDEFDKLFSDKNSNLGEFNSSTQMCILDLLDARFSASSVDRPGSNHDLVLTEADRDRINNSLIILSGALDHIFNKEATVKINPGFISKPIETEQDVDNWRKLLLEEGAIPEVIGRIISICKTNKLNKEEIKQLLNSKNNSILSKYYFLLDDVVLTDEEIDKLSEEVGGSRFGVRDLEGRVFEIVQKKILDRVDINYVVPQILGLTSEPIVEKYETGTYNIYFEEEEIFDED